MGTNMHRKSTLDFIGLQFLVKCWTPRELTVDAVAKSTPLVVWGKNAENIHQQWEFACFYS